MRSLSRRRASASTVCSRSSACRGSLTLKSLGGPPVAQPSSVTQTAGLSPLSPATLRTVLTVSSTPACVEPIRVHGERVEGARAARRVHRGDVVAQRHAQPAVGQPGGHDLRPRIHAPDPAPGRAQQRHVLGRVRPARPVDGQVRLVPHLPGAHGQPRQAGMLAPEAPARAVAAGEHRAELAHVGRPAGRIGPAPRVRRRARAERRRVEEDRQQPQAPPRERGHVAVVERQVVAAGRALDARPVEGLAHDAGARGAQAVEVSFPVGPGLAERVLRDQAEKAPAGSRRRLVALVGPAAQHREHRQAGGEREGAGERAPSLARHGGADAARPAAAARRSRAL